MNIIYGGRILVFVNSVASECGLCAFYHILEIVQVIHNVECNVNALCCLQIFSMENSFENIFCIQLIKSPSVDSPDIKVPLQLYVSPSLLCIWRVSWTPGRKPAWTPTCHSWRKRSQSPLLLTTMVDVLSLSTGRSRPSAGWEGLFFLPMHYRFLLQSFPICVVFFSILVVFVG